VDGQASRRIGTAYVSSRLDDLTRMLAGRFPEVSTMLADAAEDLLAFSSFPEAHWRKIWSKNPLSGCTGRDQPATQRREHPTTRRWSSSRGDCIS